MDHRLNPDEGSSSDRQRKAKKRPWYTDEDLPGRSGPETSTWPPAPPKLLRPGASMVSVTPSKAPSLLERFCKASGQEDCTDSESSTDDFPTSEDSTDSESSTEYSVAPEHHADSGSSTEDCATPDRGRRAQPVPLAELKCLKGSFTGATIDCELPCTAAKGTTCQIVGHLSAWNEFLYPGSLELRETSGTTGKLSLVCCESHPTFSSARQLHQVASLIHWLLMTHHCVAHVELDVSDFQAYRLFLSDALQSNSFVTSLKLMLGGRREDSAPDILPLSHLQELECTGYLEHTGPLVARLSTFVRATSSLTALRISEVCLHGSGAENLFRALGENSSLKELALPDSIIALAPPAALAVFTDYMKSSTSLTSLSVAAGRKVYMSLKLILEGLLLNGSIVGVDLQGLAIDQVAVQLISKIFAENKVLRNFKLSCASKYYSNINYSVQDPPTKTDSDCCLKALADNETLRQVALPIDFWNAEQWKVLFEALPTKQSIEMMTIEVANRRPPLLPKVCAALRETSAGKKVSFKASLMAEKLDDMLTCEAFSEVVLYTYERNRTAVCRFLERLQSLSHVTSLHLGFDFYSNPEEMSSAVTTFLRATRTLKSLTISAGWDGLLYDFQEALMAGLALNTSLRELRVQVEVTKMYFSRFAKPLADAISASKNISRVCYAVEGQNTGERAFFRRLSKGIANNYTLLSVTTPESACNKTESYWFDVWDVTRRNSDLVTAAADFARGARCDRHCALALERVHGHPELVEQVARLESVDEAQAAAMVRDRLRSMEGMHDFMRLTGVVKVQVTCHARKDTRTQLDSLNEYCWRVVRRYLKLRDVGDATTAVPSYPCS